MLVHNQNFQEVELFQIVDEILQEFNYESDMKITETDAQIALSQMFYESGLAGNQYMFKK